MREAAGSTAAIAARCRNFRRGSFMTMLRASARARRVPARSKMRQIKGSRPPMAPTLPVATVGFRHLPPAVHVRICGKRAISGDGPKRTSLDLRSHVCFQGLSGCDEFRVRALVGPAACNPFDLGVEGADARLASANAAIDR